MSRSSALIKTTVLISVAKLAVQASAFLLLPVYTRYLSSSDYGVLELSLAYMGLLAPLFLLQTDAALFRILIDKRSNFEATRHTISSIWLFAIGALGVTMVLAVVGGQVFKNPIITYAGLVIAAYMFLSLAQQTARGIGEINAYVSSSLVSGFTVIAGNLFALLVFKAGPLGVLAATAVGYSFGALMALILIRFWRLFSFRSASWHETRTALRYSVPLVPNGVSWWLIDAGGRAVLAIVQGLAAVGLYGVASKFAMILSQVFGYFNLAWIESASLSIGDDDRTSFYSTVFNRSIQASCGMVVLLIAGLPIYFPILVHSSFMEAAPLVPLLLLGALFNAWVTLYSSIYLAMKDTRAVLATTATAAVLALVLGVSLVSSLGVYAIAISSLTAWVTVLIFRHLSLRSTLHILYTPYTWVVVLTTVATGLCATASTLAGIVWPHLPIIALAFIFAAAANYPLLRDFKRSHHGKRTSRS